MKDYSHPHWAKEELAGQSAYQDAGNKYQMQRCLGGLQGLLAGCTISLCGLV
jgi:hypothetical protein